MAINLKPIPEQFRNADAETRRQIWEINVAEALKNAISAEELEKLDKRIALSLANLNNKLINLDTRFTALDKRIVELEKPKPTSQLEVNQDGKGQEVKKEVPSTSWKEKLIKLLQK